MKTKYLFYIIIIIFTFLLVLGVNCNAAYASPGIDPSNYFNPDDPVTSSNIPDDNFRRVITDDYGVLTLGDCENIKILTAIGEKIKDIEGIRYFLSLEKLYMMDNSIDNIPYSIHLLTSLKIIDFSENDLTTDDLLQLQGYFPDATIDI